MGSQVILSDLLRVDDDRLLPDPEVESGRR